MKKFGVLLVAVMLFVSCNVTESIVFNDDGSGDFNMSYDLGVAMALISEMGAEGNNAKKESKVVDTTLVFKELFEGHKDSIAALPEEKRLVLEAIQDMYMRTQIDEENKVFDFGMGMEFESIEDLEGIREKVKKVKSINAKGQELDAIKESSPVGKFMGNDDLEVHYEMTGSSFVRTTDLTEAEIDKLAKLFDDLKKNAQSEAEEENASEQSDGDEGLAKNFEGSFYQISYTFPIKIKSYSIDGAEISDDERTITFKSSWIDYLKNPKLMDIKVEFSDE